MLPSSAPQHAGAHSPNEAADQVIARARKRVGTTLRGKWRLDVLLGIGGMAAVYAATHRNKSRAAVKMLHLELSTNADIRTRFLREGYTANTVEHDGVVKVIDDDLLEDGSLYLVTELLDGETLEQRRVRLGGALPAAEILALVDQALDALAAAHAKGVVHRDLKPDNLFLTRAGKVKLLDFGIARLREPLMTTPATYPGSTMGTPAFMPPEQARGVAEEVDPRSDLWAVGATMFTLLTGRCVHGGRTRNEMLACAMTVPVATLASVHPGAHPDFAAVVDRALAFDKNDRWPDARAMQGAVCLAFEQLQGVPISEAPTSTIPETLFDRTGASVSSHASRERTTANPVMGASQASARGGLAGWRSVVASAAVAMAIVVVGAAVVHRTSARGAGASATTQTPASPASTGSPAANASPSSTPSAGIPVMSVEDLRLSRDPERAPARPHHPAAPAASGAPSAGAAASPSNASACVPPYVLDAQTGKKTWKVECL